MTLKKQRSYYFDNLKFFLITLVVIGHVIEPLIINYSKAKLVYSFIYTFHMPLFAFVSGYFSKNKNGNHNITYKISNILVPYIIFQVLYCLFNIYVLKAENFSLTFVYPYWITWYLLSLFIWNTLLPYFLKINYSIVLAIIISLIAGYDSNIGYYLSISRTITFFPYFLIGCYFKREYIDILKDRISKPLSMLILIISILGTNFIISKIDYKWFYGSFSYEQLNSTGLYGVFIKMCIYVLAIFISVLILVLIPKSKLFFTKLGSRTMPVYIFHGFIVKLFIKYNVFVIIIQDNTFINESLIIIFSLIIVFVLSSKIVTKITKTIMMTKLLRQLVG